VRKAVFQRRPIALIIGSGAAIKPDQPFWPGIETCGSATTHKREDAKRYPPPILDERLVFLRTVAAIGGWAPLLEIDALEAKKGAKRAPKEPLDL
jgi:hypothetical protein